MKIALYSDLHAHPYSNGTLLEHGSNSRVMDAANVIGQVYSYAIDNEISHVVFGGDLFDRRKSIDVDTYNTIHKCVQDWASQVSTFMIPGNHDQANKSGTIHALQRFQSPTCKIFSDPEWVELSEGVYLFGVPYYDDGEFIAECIRKGLEDKPEGDRHLLLIHYGIEGAKLGPSDYVIPCELKLPMLCLDEWDIVFSGHYHIGQQLGSKFHYIGSAMQHRWDDVGFGKTFVVYDSETNTFSRVPTVAPTFLEIRDKTKNHDVKNCFVRIIRDYEISADKKPKIEASLKEKGALSVEFRYEPEKVDSEHSERIVFSESGGRYQILDDYVSSNLVETAEYDLDRLLNIGKKILSQALDEV